MKKRAAVSIFILAFFLSCTENFNKEKKIKRCHCFTGLPYLSKNIIETTDTLTDRNLYLVRKEIIPYTLEGKKLEADSVKTYYYTNFKILQLKSDSTFTFGDLSGRWKIDTAYNCFYFYREGCPCDSSLFFGASNLLYNKSSKLFLIAHTYIDYEDSIRYTCAFYFRVDSNYRKNQGKTVWTKTNPAFSDYPVAVYRGRKAKADVTNDSIAMRHRLAFLTPNDNATIAFGGHFAVARWQHGAHSVGGLIIDLTDGKTYELPACTLGYEYVPDSRLLVVNPNGTGSMCYTCKTEYWLWNDDVKKFERLKLAGLHLPGSAFF